MAHTVQENFLARGQGAWIITGTQWQHDHFNINSRGTGLGACGRQSIERSTVTLLLW